MAHRTLAEFITQGQQDRLERLFQELLLATPSEEGGPQRIIENEDDLKELLQRFFKSRAEPYFMVEGKEFTLRVDYSTPLSKTHTVAETQWLKMPPSPKSGKPTHKLQLVCETGYCASDKMLGRALRKAGLEHADAWDLRAFVQKIPLSKDIVPRPVQGWYYPNPHAGYRIRAGGTQIPSFETDSDRQRPWMATAMWKYGVTEPGQWEFSFEFGGGFLLVRRIEGK